MDLATSGSESLPIMRRKMGRGDNGDDNETKKERVVLIQSSLMRENQG